MLGSFLQPPLESSRTFSLETINSNVLHKIFHQTIVKFPSVRDGLELHERFAEFCYRLMEPDVFFAGLDMF